MQQCVASWRSASTRLHKLNVSATPSALSSPTRTVSRRRARRSDAATERDAAEKMERLERGVREAARLAERVLADRVAAFDSQLRLYPETYCRDDAQEHEEAKAKLAALRAALEGP